MIVGSTLFINDKFWLSTLNVTFVIIEFNTIDSNSYISGFFIWPINELDLWNTLHCKWIKIVKIINEYEKVNA
jgi:hypothetical protein